MLLGSCCCRSGLLGLLLLGMGDCLGLLLGCLDELLPLVSQVLLMLLGQILLLLVETLLFLKTECVLLLLLLIVALFGIVGTLQRVGLLIRVKSKRGE